MRLTLTLLAAGCILAHGGGCERLPSSNGTETAAPAASDSAPASALLDPAPTVSEPEIVYTVQLARSETPDAVVTGTFRAPRGFQERQLPGKHIFSAPGHHIAFTLVPGVEIQQQIAALREKRPELEVIEQTGDSFFVRFTAGDVENFHFATFFPHEGGAIQAYGVSIEDRQRADRMRAWIGTFQCK